MSHVVVLDLEIKSLEAVQRMCANLGWVFHENQKTYRWYGQWVGDYNAADAATRQGFNPEDLGKCDHAISVPGVEYELGLKWTGEKFSLVWDFWDKKLQSEMGGTKGEKFMQEYGLACVTLEAEQQGYTWTSRKLDNGSYEIEVQTY